jgi:hypothetical protein
MVSNATGHIVLAEVREHNPVIIVVIVLTVLQALAHNAAIPTGEAAVQPRVQVRGLTGPIHPAALPIQGRVHLQAEALVTGVLPGPIVQGAREAVVQGIEVLAGAVVREAPDSGVPAGDQEVPVVRLEAQEVHSVPQVVRSDLVAEADQAVADQVVVEADNNSINRLKK